MKAGADPNIKSLNDETPLQLALKYNMLPMVNALKEAYLAKH
jgi:ankyrin repeat protein